MATPNMGVNIQAFDSANAHDLMASAKALLAGLQLE
jgi:hypothetical protein